MVAVACYVLRRANAFNTPWVLNRPKDDDNTKPISKKQQVRRFGANRWNLPTALAEEHTLSLPQTATVDDLQQDIERRSGISSRDLILCRCCTIEEVPGRAKEEVPEGPQNDQRFTQLVRLSNGDDSLLLYTDSSRPPRFVAFESTLSRPQPSNPVLPVGLECRVYDTDTLPEIAKALSRSAWPKTSDQLHVALRVDVQHRKNKWFPGSVVELLEDTKKVRVHFDRFSSKWDEIYAIEDFTNGRLLPLYSRVTPITKPLELLVYHRYINHEPPRKASLFGQSFWVQFHREWTLARAGAQILAQTARFLDGPRTSKNPKLTKAYNRSNSVLSELIDILVEADREYLLGSLGYNKHKNGWTPARGLSRDEKESQFHNPDFDPASLNKPFLERVNRKLRYLPFEVRVGRADSPFPEPDGEEVTFPFSLLRIIGNYISARHCIVLQWRLPPKNCTESPIMYVPPTVASVPDGNDGAAE